MYIFTTIMIVAALGSFIKAGRLNNNETSTRMVAIGAIFAFIGILSLYYTANNN